MTHLRGWNFILLVITLVLLLEKSNASALSRPNLRHAMSPDNSGSSLTNVLASIRKGKHQRHRHNEARTNVSRISKREMWRLLRLILESDNEKSTRGPRGPRSRRQSDNDFTQRQIAILIDKIERMILNNFRSDIQRQGPYKDCLLVGFIVHHYNADYNAQRCKPLKQVSR